MKRIRIIFWVLIITLLFVNTYILLLRNEGYKYFPYKTYSQLYVTDSTFYIKDIHFTRDTLELIFSLQVPSKNYRLSIDDSISNKSVAVLGPSIAIPLVNNVHIYKLTPLNPKCSKIIVQVDHSKNNGTDDTNEFIYSNLPGPQIKVSPYNLWTKGIESFTANEVKQGKDFLSKNSNALLVETDSAKVLEVCKIISRLRPNTNGIKAAEASSMLPYQQLQ